MEPYREELHHTVPSPNARNQHQGHEPSPNRGQLEATHSETLGTMNGRSLDAEQPNVLTSLETVKLDAPRKFGGAYGLKSEKIIFCPIPKVHALLLRVTKQLWHHSYNR